MQNTTVVSTAEVCGCCHITLARVAPRVVDKAFVYHLDCYEASHLLRYGHRPVLRATQDGDPHRYAACRYEAGRVPG